VHTPGGGHLPLPGRTPPARRALSNATTEAQPAQIRPRRARIGPAQPRRRTARCQGADDHAVAVAGADRRRRRCQLKPAAAASDCPNLDELLVRVAEQREPSASPPPSLEAAGFPAGLLRRRRGRGRWGRKVEGARVGVAVRVAPAGATRGQAETFSIAGRNVSPQPDIVLLHQQSIR
jgi:hypothetical protein